LKDTQVQNIQQELQKLHTVKKLHEEEINSLKKEVQHALESKDKLWSNAASASNESEQLIFALRNELQETLSSMSNLKKEYAESKANMYIRQEQLEKSNAELGKNVVDLEKELLDLVAKTKMIDSLNALPASSINNNDNSSNSSNSNHLSSNLLSNSSVGSEEYRVLQQNLIAMKKSFHEESRRNEVYKQEILGLTQELKKVKNTFEKAEESFAKDSLILRKENENLKEKLQEHLSKENNDTTSINMEARIQILTNRLIEKQESIDAYRSKMTTLEIRLSDAQNRNRIVEEKLQHFQRNGGIIDDVEMASETPHQNRGGLRARTNRLSHAISQVAPVLDRSTRVVTALDVVDKWLLFLGRFFLNYPFARLAMLAYLGLIHFWVFVVLSFHTSHLQEEIRQTAPPRGGVID
jgi:chromosome segregation ATPase